MGWGWGESGCLNDKITARQPHPPPNLPLEEREELMRKAFPRLPCATQFVIAA